jgi:hypothetical protein
MIDTSSAIKKKISPIKPEISKQNVSNGQKKQEKVFSSLKEGVQNIFATSKS